MKKPFLFALTAAIYIVIIVFGTFTIGSALENKEENLIMPITMLGLFVLSAAVMGFLFLSEPLKLFLENRKHEAVAFFAKTVGIFACFVAVLVISLFLI